MGFFSILWAGIKGFFGFGGSAVGGAATGGVLPALQAGAALGKATIDASREGKRESAENAIEKEREANDAKIDASVDAAKKSGAATALLFALLLLPGCASTPPGRDTTPTTGNVGRLMSRPDYGQAVTAAPEWVRDALKTVNDREAEVQYERLRSRRVN